MTEVLSVAGGGTIRGCPDNQKRVEFSGPILDFFKQCASGRRTARKPYRRQLRRIPARP